MKKKKEKSIAWVAQKAESIDMAKIYYIKVGKTLKTGTTIRFDTGNESFIEYENKKATP